MKRLFILIMLSLTMTSSYAFAQNASIAAGVNWLVLNQNYDKSWGITSSSTTTFTTTADVLYAIRLNGHSSISFNDGLAWLNHQTLDSVNFAANRLRVCSVAGLDTTADLNRIINWKNSIEGSWGLDDDYSNDSLEVALALQALHAANYPDLSVSNTALAYLINSQNPDGGWGFSSDDASSIYMTAIVSATLQQYPQTASLANSLTKATAYLLGWQNLDGGYGATGSTVYETAHAYAALVAVTNDTVVLDKALNYLVSSKSANGSWNDDPYSTALALKALYLAENKPAPPPAAATTGSVMGTIVDETTKAPLAGVTAVLTADPTVTAKTDANGMFALSGIPAGAQQITLSRSGYATVTVTASISAGTFINLGKVGMSVNPTSGTVMGTVWNADRDTPFGGVTVQATSGLQMVQTLTAPDGTYKITGVNPGTVTVGTPQGPAGEGVYWNVSVTGALAAGGIFLYSPRMSQTPPPFINIYAEPAKALYRKGDTVGLAVILVNNRSIGYETIFKVSVTNPSGASVYDTSEVVELTPKGTIIKNPSFTLPANTSGGFYNVLVETFGAGGEKLASTTTTFGVFVSQIAVTPIQPASYATDQNTVSFTLTNTGNYAVTAGNLTVGLADPDGQVITTLSQPFTLGRGENTLLTYTFSLPALKFGTYTLTYTQSDETTDGEQSNLTLPNTVTISPVLDKASYAVRETAKLLINVTNTGMFSLAGFSAVITMPDAAHVQSEILALNRRERKDLTSAIPLPASLSAGNHAATITLTLPSGSTATQTIDLNVPEPALSVSLTGESYSAGQILEAVIANTGGADTTAEYTLSLTDAKAFTIASDSASVMVQAGTNAPLSLAIPSQAAEGHYVLTVAHRDTITGKAGITKLPLTINGVKADLAVQTDKEIYFTTENIMALTQIENTGSELQNGNLHLQVVSGGSVTSKTWTSQADFQQGTRNGVDTYGVNDWLIPSDDFEGTTVNTDKWDALGNVTIQSGKVVISCSVVPSYIQSKWQLEGDFDIQVDFDANNSVGSQGAEISVFSDSFYVYFHNLQAGGYGSGTYINANNGFPFMGGTGIGGYTLSGRFRITRNLSTITTYYWSGSTWIQVNQSTYQQLQGPAKVRLWIWNEPGLSNASTTFDNFKVNSGRIVTKNETVDSVRLLPISDNFDDGVINLDRWAISGALLPQERSGYLHLADNKTGGTVGTGAALRTSLIGNFKAYTSFRNYSTNPTPATYGRYMMRAWFENESMTNIYIDRNSSMGSEFILGRSFINGVARDMGYILSYTSDSGMFRLRRDGNTGYDDYWNGTQWVTFIPSQGCRTSLVMSLFKRYPKGKCLMCRLMSTTFIQNQENTRLLAS